MTKMGVIYRLSTDYITIYYEDFWGFAVFRSLNLVGLALAIIYKYKEKRRKPSPHCSPPGLWGFFYRI